MFDERTQLKQDNQCWFSLVMKAELYAAGLSLVILFRTITVLLSLWYVDVTIAGSFTVSSNRNEY